MHTMDLEVPLLHIRTPIGMGAIWWGTRETCPPTFLDGGYIICHVPPLFSLRVCIWRGFKTKYHVCHVLCEEFFRLDHGRNFVGDTGDVSPRFFRWGGYNMPCPPTFSLQVLHLEKFQK